LTSLFYERKIKTCIIFEIKNWYYCSMKRKLNTCRQALLSTHPLYPPMTFHLFVYTRRPYAWPLNELINFLNFVNHVTRQNGIVFIYFRWPCRLYSNTQLYMFYIFPLVIQWSNTVVYLHNFCVAFLPAIACAFYLFSLGIPLSWRSELFCSCKTLV